MGKSEVSEEMDTIGGRRRGASNHQAEDQALDQIAKENFDSNVYAAQNTILPYAPTWQHQPSWMKYRDIANSVALVGGLAYAVYWFYKKYLAPFLFGEGKKGLDSRLSDLDKTITSSLSDLKSSISRVRDDMERLTERRVESLSRQIEELKNEVGSLKKLMLNRKQFPSATVTGPLTIPSWQLASAAEEKEVEEEGAGSGTNGSDSSLEMIKE